MKCYVLIISEYFPSNHRSAGKETFFCYGIKCYDKIHTIRTNYDLWEKRMLEIEKGNAYLSVRIWDGLPYRSKQREIFRYDRRRKIGIEKLQMTESGWMVNDRGVFLSSEVLAKNDGLDLPDFNCWFDGKIHIGMEPLAIIHFTDFRYAPI